MNSDKSILEIVDFLRGSMLTRDVMVPEADKLIFLFQT